MFILSPAPLETIEASRAAHNLLVNVESSRPRHHLNATPAMNLQLPFGTPLVLALLLSSHGLRKRSLSPSGAVAAFVVGYTMMAVPLIAFGVSLIVFYLTGSRAVMSVRRSAAAPPADDGAMWGASMGFGSAEWNQFLSDMQGGHPMAVDRLRGMNGFPK